MEKRKNSTSGVTADDPTETSEGRESYFLEPTRHDFIPLFLSIIVIAAGLTAALTSFFLLQNNDRIAARNVLEVTMKTIDVQLTEAFADVVSVILSTAAFFQVSRTPITLYDQFEPFVMASGSFPKFLTSLTRSQYIHSAEADSYVQMMRDTGLPEYANFTITGRDDNNNKIPPPYTPIRCVVTQTTPSVNLPTVVGYDPCSNSQKNASWWTAISTRKPSASGGVLSVYSSQISITVIQGLYNNTNGSPIGSISGVILLSDLIQQALSTLINRFDVSLYDLNSTNSDQFLYTTTTSGRVTSTQTLDKIANAPYTFSAQVPIANRVFKAVLIPQDDYPNLYDTSIKYIALAISLIITGILLIGCMFLYFTRKLLIAKQKRQEANIQIDLLKTNQGALRTLLDRIACQEEKTRAVINSLPDCVCVINHAGKILQTNTAFDNEFPFTQKEMEKGVYTWDIFTEVSSDFFRVCEESQEILTQAARRFGDMTDVSVRVRDLRSRSGESSQSNEIKQMSGTSIQLVEAEESYVIITKNLCVKEDSHGEISTEERVQRHEFEKKFRDKQFREELKKFCEKHRNVENVLFLEQVKEYKKAQFGVRVDLKMAIYERFIKSEAPMQLNLANEVVMEESFKITKSMGDVDVFKVVEECVVKTLANDIYPRFMNDQRKISSERQEID